MASLVRRRMAKLRAWRFRIATTIQNAGRGYLARARHIHTIAAIMEYLTTLEEAQEQRRQTILNEERTARDQLAKYLQLTGSKFLRSMRKKSTATTTGDQRKSSRRSVSPLVSLLDDDDNNNAAAVVRVLVPSPKLGAASPRGRPSMMSGDTVMSSCELIRPGSFALGGGTPPSTANSPKNEQEDHNIKSTSSSHVVMGASLEHSLPHTAPHQRSIGADSLTTSSSDAPIHIMASPIAAAAVNHITPTSPSSVRQLPPPQRPASAAPRVATAKKVTSSVPSRLYSTPAWASTNMHGVLLGTNKPTISPPRPQSARPQEYNHIPAEPRAPSTSRPETAWTRPTHSAPPINHRQPEHHRTNRRRPTSARTPL